MQTTSSHFLGIPHTKPGWWAVGLAVASVAGILAWSILPGGAWFGFLCGLAGGVIGLTAIIRQHERSLLVWLTILPLAFVIFFLVGEFLFPH